mmetsp:Transcript_30362/g.68081  ORF Transcript_30362/g.68081 Transcript_30362/m.68081 type:complete len:400 (+) Transcript_30362:111-1310(+)|eukprot:CAMPEP_0172617298 /NCGR_PEP_ID=MMETSP1068-20121228/70163_1 /TAXON_ID=35684 /ORGANISM="Pseudopedinella elastica, Strain CCMP716" /LENGTH=399 /DNA_ID=CAMNT_0013423033 /DNA_START=106 /DNA_END=1308 /DNA_ORIENTATION=-
MPGRKGPEDDLEAMYGEGAGSQQYAKVSTDDLGSARASSRASSGVPRKGAKTREQVASENAKEQERQNHKFGDPESALGDIQKAQFVLKFLAILQNPGKILQIVKAKNIHEDLEKHYGTEDPIEVARIVMHDLRDGVEKGTWSIGRMAFFGGCYCSLIGALTLLPFGWIFLAFTPLAFVNAVTLVFFGLVTMTMESEGDTISAQFKANIQKYCGALSEIWGRGIFYLYLGVTQILGPRNHFFGYYMSFVGLVYLLLYRMTIKHIKEMREIFKDEAKLNEAYAKVAGEDGVLNRHELAVFLHEIGIDLGHAEMEMMLKRLDPNNDGMISLKELKAAMADHAEQDLVTYTIGPMPRLDHNKGDQIKVLKPKTAALHTGQGAHPRDQQGHLVLPKHKVKAHR